MKPRITVLTIGVDNLEKSYAFYHNGLGLASKGIVGKEFEHGAIAFFDLENGITLALYRASLLPWMPEFPFLLPAQASFPSAIT